MYINENDLDNRNFARSNKNPIRIALFIVLVLGFAVKYIVGLSIPVYVFLAIASAIAVVSDVSGIVSLVICCIPFSTFFQYKYLELICLFIILIRKRKIYLRQSILWSFVVLILWEVLHVFIGDFSFIEVVRSFSEYLFIVFVLVPLDVDKEIDYEKMVRSLAVSILTVCIIIFAIQAKQNGFGSFLSLGGNTRFGFGLGLFNEYDANFNPNMIGKICVLSISCIMQIYITGRAKLFDYILIVLLFIFSFLTMARSALIVAIFLFLLFLTTKGKVSMIKKSVITIVVIVALMILVNKFFPTQIGEFMLRLQAEDILNGRGDIFKSYHTLFTSTSLGLFGVGIQDFKWKLFTLWGMNTVPHTAYQELVAIWGYPGMVIFLVYLLAIFADKKYTFKRRLINYFPLIVVFLYTLTGQLVTNGKNNLMLMVAYISMFHCFEKYTLINGKD